MDYAKQKEYLEDSRIWSGGIAVMLIAIAAICLRAGGARTPGATTEFVMTVAALGISVWYTPDYLHLTVNSQKRARWEVKVRWRLIGAVLMMGLIFGGGARGAIVTFIATAWLVGANLLAKAAVPADYFPAWFWWSDFALLSALLLERHFDLLLGGAMLSAGAHLSIVICERHPIRWAGIVLVSGAAVMLLASQWREASLEFSLTATALVLASAGGTAWLIKRAQQQNRENTNGAMRELMDFTGYPAERVKHLWSVSDLELAKNWQAAGLAEDDREGMAEWYRENSELYMFAIAGYNLDYKRIRSNLGVLKFARGACLDYGAGNGELILELARQGHPPTYFDVDGTSMKFARHRAQGRKLEVEFLHANEDLAAAAGKRGFDTVLSFDVLEHLPDLTGELDFLCSLLNPGGVLVFDVPAGSTTSHPMHLNHNVNVREHLRAKGLEEKQSLLQRLPFRKLEKYVFRARG
jgi:SAM-dependent methyltransferase